MLVIIIIISIIALFLLIRLSLLHKEMKRITSDLKRLNPDQTDEHLQIALIDQTLEALVVEINEVITSRQQIKGAAIRSERELNHMITSMSHDLRTPLTAMMGYIQLLERKDLTDADYTRYLSIIESRAKQLHALIQNFFSLSLMHNDEHSLEIERIDLKALVQTSALTYYDTFQDNNQTVELEIANDSMVILGDETACTRIIENILLNALQHGRDNITIKLRSTDEGVVFTVKNTYEAEEELNPERLFDRLYTGEQSRKQHRGLGLYITERLMEQMNGRVLVEVESGIFSITCLWKTDVHLESF